MAGLAFGNTEAFMPNKIFLGTWTNWSRGATMGATLTLTRRNADLVIAFTAFFISFVGVRLWRIICLFLHRHFSSSKAEDALHHQRQAILRNSSSADAGIWSFAQLFWVWRRRAPKAFIRLLPACIISLLFLAAFVVAGGFSSQMSTLIGNEVLVVGTDCGLPVFTSPDGDTTPYYAMSRWGSRLVSSAHNYAQQCYLPNSTSTTGCGDYIIDHIVGIQTSQDACIFKEEVCRSNSTNIILDSGFLDSHYDLGINSPTQDRIYWRNILTCEPLETKGFTSTYQTNSTTYSQYNYGPVFSTYNATDLVFMNYTYELPGLDSQYDKANPMRMGTDYRIASAGAAVVNGSLFVDASAFIPIPSLNRTDADIMILFLSGDGVVFIEPTEDEWIRATDQRGYLGYEPDGSNTPYYIPNDAAWPLGCTNQYQYCYSDTKACGPLASPADALQGVLGLFANSTSDKEQNRLTWFSSVLQQFPSTLDSVIGSIGGEGLLCRQQMMDGLQGAIEKNQWQLEVANMWATTLAVIQNAFVETASGVSDPSIQKYNVPPGNPDANDMCRNQKIRSTAHGSFSLFALLFTYITGVFLTALSFSIESVFACCWRRRKYQEYKHLEWVTNSTLQLQRLAYEQSSAEKWGSCTGSIPTTEHGALLQCLDLGDPKHPRLRSNPDGDSAVEAKYQLIAEKTSSKCSSGGADMVSPVTTVCGPDGTAQGLGRRGTL